MNYRSAILSLLVLLACYVVLYLFLGYWRAEPLWADGPGYVECGRMFFQEYFKVHPTRPFGCALVFGWPFLWSREGAGLDAFVSVVQFGFWLGSVVLLWRILLIIHPTYAHWVALLYGLNAGALVFSRQINSETPFIFFTAFALFAWLRHCQSRSKRWLVASFALLCFATLIRPSGQYFVAGLLLLALVRGFYHFFRERKFNTLFVPGLLALIFCLTIGMRVAQMNRTYGVFSMTVIQDFDLYVYLAGYSELWHHPDREARGAAWKEQSELRWRELADIRDSSGYAASTRYARFAFFQRLREAPSQVFITYCRNIFSNSVAPSFYIARLDADAASQGMAVRLLQFISRLQNMLYSALVLVVIPFWMMKKAGGLRSWIKAVTRSFAPLETDAPGSGGASFWLMGWFFGLYIILTGAIAFAAGDRLHLPVVPFAVVSAYAILYGGKNRLFSNN